MEQTNVSLTIDGKSVMVESGKTILDAALENGIYIPHLCSHENLHPVGACRMCMVGVQGRDGVVTSCTTRVESGMVIDTKDALAEKIRKLSTDLMFKTHPSECVGCPKYGKCQLQSILQVVGDTGRKLYSAPIRIPADAHNPMILHEMSRCILCGRCVRACSELRGVGAIHFKKADNGRMRISVDGASLNEAGCRFCGACVEVCPTGSIREHEAIAEKAVGKPRNDALVPCRAGCPAHIDIPRYIRFIQDGNFLAASAVVREKSPFPRVLGAVCTHPCELECKRNVLNSPVSIRNLKRYAAEHEDDTWRSNVRHSPSSGMRVAIIGAGPAGMTAARYLASKGHSVTVFEKMPKPGGMMRYGIPPHRLSPETIDCEIRDILDLGVMLQTGVCVTHAPDLLLQGFAAVYAAVGTHRGVALTIPGNTLQGVLINTDFLRLNALGTPPPIGDRVIVLGGGNVALDCASVARRLGAREVHLAFLESNETMPSTEEERKWAEEEGIQLHPSASFLEILGEGGKVSGLKIASVKSFRFEADGRSVIDLVPDSEQTLDADTIIFAVGQRPDLTDAFGLELARGRITLVDGCNTSVEGVFAGGDAVTGTQSVIQAIAAGRLAAQQIDRYLGGDGEIEEALAPVQYRCPHIGKRTNFGMLPRQEAEVVSPEIRVNGFDRMDLGFTEETALCEAARCMQCDLRTDIAPQQFWSSYSQGGGKA